jgi:GT2 family glycosyltransferase
VVVTTYEQPGTLLLVLAALDRQSRVPDEVVVADDGSSGAAIAALEADAGRHAFRLLHVWQPHDGFRAARSRNNGIHHATGRCIGFLDQDTVPHRDWLATHLAAAGPGRVGLGYAIFLTEDESAGLRREDVESGLFERRHSPRAMRRLRQLHRKCAFYAFLRRAGCAVKSKPTLKSGNFLACRDDLVEVNGFDEEYAGWGQEDDDLGRRLYAIGVRPAVLHGRALVTHLPHPTRRPPEWKAGANIRRYREHSGRARCRCGLNGHPHPDVRMRVLNPGRV